MSDEFVLKFKGEISGKEQVDEFFTSANRGADRFEASLKKAFSSAGSAISSFAGKAKSELQDLAGKELGGSLGSNARGVLQLRDAITALAVSSGKGTEVVGDLRQQIEATAKASNQLQGDVTDALQAFVEKTGDLETARKNIELYGKAATATGAAVKDLSLVGVELADKLGIKNQANSFAILATQSKAGAIELKDLATKGPRIFAAAASAGATGEQGLREAGALAQTYAKAFGGAGSAARVATAVERTFSDILKKSSKIEGLGIQVQGRDQFEVLKDIIRTTGGDKQRLLNIFGVESIRGVDVLAREFRQTGRFDTFDKFRDVVADPRILSQDFATRNSTGLAKLRAQEIAKNAFFDNQLGGVAEFAAAHATELQLGAAGLSFGGKGLGLLGGLLGSGGGVLGKAGGALSSVTATPVRVVNWPAGGLPGGAGGAAEGGVAGVAGRTAVGLLGGLGGAVAIPALGLLGVGYLIKRQQDDIKAKEQAFNASHPVDTEAAKYFGTEFARSHNAVVRRGEMQTGDLGTLPAPEVNITIHSNENLEVKGDSGTRDPKVMDRRGGGG